jgi:hypothetical protein
MSQDERVVSRPSGGGDDPGTMPVELIIFAANRRVSGAIPLADDRVSDMLNSVQRVVMRHALIEDLDSDAPGQTADVTLAIGSIVAVLVSGRPGSEARRQRTERVRARIGLTRFVVSGSLHVPARADAAPDSTDPAVVLAGRDMLVPLTDATISYDRADVPTSEHHETILVNRAYATWIDLDGAEAGRDSDLVAGRRHVYHASMIGTVSDLR